GTVLAWRMPAGPLETIRVPENRGPIALAANGQLAMPGPDRVALSEIGSSREIAPLPLDGDIDWDEFKRRAIERLSIHKGPNETGVARHQGARAPVAFSPDGRYLIAARADFIARVWDQSGRLMLTEPFYWEITSAAFAPKGQFLAMVKDRASLEVFAL